MAELSLPDGVQNRLCFFSVPDKLIPFYKKYIFPVVKRLDLIPISADDVISIGDNWIAKITALINRSEFIVIDIVSLSTFFALGIALSNKDRNTRILIIKDEDTPIPSDIQAHQFLTRPTDPYEEPELIAEQVEVWFNRVLEPLKSTYQEEPERLLKKKEYRAAVISAISLLESYIRNRLSEFKDLRKSTKSLYSLVQLAVDFHIIHPDKMGNIKEWMHIRNNAIHFKRKVSYQEARRIVKGVMKIIRN